MRSFLNELSIVFVAAPILRGSNEMNSYCDRLKSSSSFSAAGKGAQRPARPLPLRISLFPRSLAFHLGIATLFILIDPLIFQLSNESYAMDMSRSRKSKNVIDLRINPDDPIFHRHLIRLSEAISEIEKSNSLYKFGVQDSFCAKYAIKSRIPYSQLTSALATKPNPTKMFSEQSEAKAAAIPPSNADACNHAFASALQSKAEQLEKIRSELLLNFAEQRKISEPLWKAISSDQYYCQKEEESIERRNSGEASTTTSTISKNLAAPRSRHSYDLKCSRLLHEAHSALREFMLSFDLAAKELDSKIDALKRLAADSTCPSRRK